MKKKLFKNQTINAIHFRLCNLLDGDGKIAQVKQAIDELFAEMENAEVEFTVEEFKKEIDTLLAEAVGQLEETQKAEVAEAIAKKFETMKNSFVGKGTKLSDAIRNKISVAILRSSGRADVEDNVRRVLVENGISGLSFNEVIDYNVADGWGDSNPIFKKLKQVKFSKFFYTTQDLTDDDILAKGWTKTSADDKAIQALALNGKTITPQYIYKIQSMAREDMVDAEAQATNLLLWLNEELDRQIVNTIVKTILVGDTVNPSGQNITSFEAIGAKTTTDAFTTVNVASVAGAPSIVELRNTVDAVRNPYAYPKVGFMTAQQLTATAAYTYVANGKVWYKTKEEVAMQLGLDELIITDMLASTGVNFVVMIPDEYWVLEKDAQSITYPKHERNEIRFQKERLIGGAIHGLKSTAILIDPTPEPEDGQ